MNVKRNLSSSLTHERRAKRCPRTHQPGTEKCLILKDNRILRVRLVISALSVVGGFLLRDSTISKK